MSLDHTLNSTTKIDISNGEIDDIIQNLNNKNLTPEFRRLLNITNIISNVAIVLYSINFFKNTVNPNEDLSLLFEVFTMFLFIFSNLFVYVTNKYNNSRNLEINVYSDLVIYFYGYDPYSVNAFIKMLSDPVVDHDLRIEFLKQIRNIIDQMVNTEDLSSFKVFAQRLITSIDRNITRSGDVYLTTHDKDTISYLVRFLSQVEDKSFYEKPKRSLQAPEVDVIQIYADDAKRAQLNEQ